MEIVCQYDDTSNMVYFGTNKIILKTYNGTQC